MGTAEKATRVELLSIRTPAMRAFHMAWVAFFFSFFAWFGVAPLLPIIRDELQLTRAQIGNTVMASVAVTVLARLLVGWLCDRYGPRKTYAALLVVGSLPVMAIGLATSYESFLLFRLAIGIIGASFVVTQYHTSMMFASRCVGTANAIAAGWGNLGGGVTQLAMPLLFSLLVGTGLSAFWSWRLCMLLCGLCCLVLGLAYYRFTQDTPQGNYAELRRAGALPPAQRARGLFGQAARDYRVWALFLLYGACFGIELTIDNIAALYFTDYFGLGLGEAGLVAALFGLMNLFARALGGYIGDRSGQRWGLRGRSRWLFLAVLGEGLALMLFSQLSDLAPAIVVFMIFGIFVDMACGATYAIVPFINKRALGPVAGIVGAGGNIGALLAGPLFSGALSWRSSLLLIGVFVVACSTTALLVRFSPDDERAAQQARRQEPAEGLAAGAA